MKKVCGLLLDATGSMQEVRSEAVSGVRNFIKEMAENSGDTSIIFATFNSTTGLYIMRRGAAKTLKNFEDSEYRPAAMTPLVDAMMDMIKSLESEVASADESKVVLAVMTDGFENASHKYDGQTLKEKVEEVQEKGWQVVFLGADIDAFTLGGSLGVKGGATASVGRYQTGETFASLGTRTSYFMENVTAGSSSVDFFSATDDAGEDIFSDRDD